MKAIKDWFKQIEDEEVKQACIDYAFDDRQNIHVWNIKDAINNGVLWGIIPPDIQTLITDYTNNQ